MENKIDELEKLLHGFLTEVLPGGTWQTYTPPKQLAEEIVKLFVIPIVRRSAFAEIDDYIENSEYNYLNKDLIEFAERLKTHLACKMLECDDM